MCRNIRPLHNYDPPTTEEEVQAAALQFVRKISGMNRPARANEEAFDRAVRAVTDASSRLLHIRFVGLRVDAIRAKWRTPCIRDITTMGRGPMWSCAFCEGSCSSRCS